MAIADFIHSEALPKGAAVKPKYIKNLAFTKHVGAEYTHAPKPRASRRPFARLFELAVR
jgi:hypothetical protein